jgi:hypothetical protein
MARCSGSRTRRLRRAPQSEKRRRRQDLENVSSFHDRPPEDRTKILTEPGRIASADD